MSTKQVRTQRSSGSTAIFCCSARYVAFAIAEFRHLAIGSAARLSVNFRIANARETPSPRIISITSRVLRWLPFRCFNLAIASISLVGGWPLAIGSHKTACQLQTAAAYFLLAIFSAFVPGCPLNKRVGENSPNLWPTIFSVTKTGMWRLPLCTPNVKPTISGDIVERRDQVLIACGFEPLSAIRRSTFCRLKSMNGPFFNERGIIQFRISNDELRIRHSKFDIRNYFLLRSFTIIFVVRLLRRVLYPRVGCPHGVTG